MDTPFYTLLLTLPKTAHLPYGTNWAGVDYHFDVSFESDDF